MTLSFLLEQTNEHLIQGALISSQNTRLHAWLGKAASPPFGTVSFLPVMHVVYYQNLENERKTNNKGREFGIYNWRLCRIICMSCQYK